MPKSAPNDKKPPCVLGIDPGLRRSGYGVACHAERAAGGMRVVEAGIIKLDARAPLPKRLLELEQSLASLIETHRPVLLSCEGLYSHYRHPQTAVLMGHARGVVLVTAARLGLRVVDVGATQVKKTLTGSGHASKEQMQRAVAATFQLAQLPEPHDVADALAIALCGWEVYRGQQTALAGTKP